METTNVTQRDYIAEITIFQPIGQFNGMLDTKNQKKIITSLKLSRGEICVANFIPPVNGASLGSG